MTMRNTNDIYSISQATNRLPIRPAESRSTIAFSLAKQTTSNRVPTGLYNSAATTSLTGAMEYNDNEDCKLISFFPNRSEINRNRLNGDVTRYFMDSMVSNIAVEDYANKLKLNIELDNVFKAQEIEQSKIEFEFKLKEKRLRLESLNNKIELEKKLQKELFTSLENCLPKEKFELINQMLNQNAEKHTNEGIYYIKIFLLGIVLYMYIHMVFFFLMTMPHR
jgi:hypothetical protein